MDAGAEMPRVLLACDWFVKYTIGLAAGLVGCGCKTMLLTRDHDLEFGGEEGAMRAAVHEALGSDVEQLQLGGRVRDVGRLRDVVRLRRRVASFSPQVVQAQESLANDVRLAVVARMRWRRYALTVHDPVPHPGDTMPAQVTVLPRRLLRRGAGLVFVHSDALAAELDGTGEVSAPIEVVPHGVEPGTTTPPPASPALLFFGRQSYYKGLDVLLDAMPAIWETEPRTTLTVAGEGELPEHPLLADPRIQLRVEHIPEEDVPGLFDACTCVVLPYRQASQSGVGSLARQYGRGVVAAAVGGLPELVAEDWGRLVPSEDPPALAAAVIEVLETPGLAAGMGRNAAESLGEAGWRQVAERTIDAYQRHLL